jgi:hypothetical protein
MSYSGNTEFYSLFHASRLLKIVHHRLAAYIKGHEMLEVLYERWNEFLNKSTGKYVVIEKRWVMRNTRESQ